MDSLFHIDTDIECKVLHYGSELCIASPGKDITITLRKGRHKLSFISTENTADSYTVMFNVPENDIEDCIMVELKPIKEKRLDEEERQRKIEYEAEQRRLQDEKRKREEQLRIEREIEQHRREEEERRRREKEEEENRRRAAEAEEQRREVKKLLVWMDNEKRYLKFLSVKEEYSKYVIPSISKKYTAAKYLTYFTKLDPYRFDSNTHYYSGRQSVSSNEPSVIFPVIRELNFWLSFSEKELIDFFAKTAFLDMNVFCIGDTRDRNHFIEKKIKWAQDALHERAVRERGNRRGIIVGPSLSSDEYRSVSKIAMEEWIQSKMDSIIAKKGRTPYALCQCLLNAKSIPIGSILAREYRNDSNEARIDFFLYMVEKYPKWRLLLREMLNPEFWEYRNPYSFENKIQSINDDSTSELVKCECKTYKVVYIDEACNEIVSVPEDYCAVSRVCNGIMVWYKRTEHTGKYFLSCRDYRGHELFSTIVDESLLQSQIFPRKEGFMNEFKNPVGGYLLIKENGEVGHDRKTLLWISGITNDISVYENVLELKRDEFVFHGQAPNFSIKHLPQRNKVGYKDGKYYLLSYQGVFEIQKPAEWDEKLEQNIKFIEEWNNRRKAALEKAGHLVMSGISENKIVSE